MMMMIMMTKKKIYYEIKSIFSLKLLNTLSLFLSDIAIIEVEYYTMICHLI
jgi:hypothetical protein